MYVARTANPEATTNTVADLRASGEPGFSRSIINASTGTAKTNACQVRIAPAQKRPPAIARFKLRGSVTMFRAAAAKKAANGRYATSVLQYHQENDVASQAQAPAAASLLPDKRSKAR